MIDVDGVLADFVLAWTQTAVDMGLLPAPIAILNQQTWSLEDFGLTYKQVRQVWSVVDNSWFWWMDRVQSLVNREQIQELDNLMTKNESWFVTNRYGGKPNVQYQTQLWLKQRGFYNPNVITTNDKGKLASALRITHSIDDKTENSNSICGKSYLLDRAYNRHDRKPRLNIIKSVNEFIEVIRKESY
jgi:hypothetical protein